MASLHEQLSFWFLAGEKGMSSEAIASRAYGVPGRHGWHSYPHDIDDFKRCYYMLKMCPAVSIECMQGVSEVWDRLVQAWPQLTAQYEADPKDWKAFSLLLNPLLSLPPL